MNLPFYRAILSRNLIARQNATARDASATYCVTTFTSVIVAVVRFMAVATNARRLGDKPYGRQTSAGR